MIRFTSKTQFYNSPDPLRGMFENAFVEPTLAEVDTQNKRLRVDFHLCFMKSDRKISIDTQTLFFTDQHIPTLIEDEGGNPVEIISFLTSGGVYDASKVIDWGYPSFERVQAYFNKESIWTGLSFADTPFIQLAIDWVRYNLPIDGEKILITGFNYNPTTP